MGIIHHVSTPLDFLYIYQFNGYAATFELVAFFTATRS